MKRLLFLLALLFGLPAAAADPLEGALPLAKDDLAAVAQIVKARDKHVLLFFGDQIN